MRLILFVLLLVSLGGNAYFLMGKGINITHHHEQHQNQQQAQLIITTSSSQGKIIWKKQRTDEVDTFLNTLAPEQSLFAKCDKGFIIYPELQTQETKAEVGPKL